jgi:hypothetical protein
MSKRAEKTKNSDSDFESTRMPASTCYQGQVYNYEDSRASSDVFNLIDCNCSQERESITDIKQAEFYKDN